MNRKIVVGRIGSWLGSLVIASGALALFAPAAQATFPGVNGKIAFVVISPQTGGRYVIYVMNGNGSGQTELTRNNNDITPAWSRDAGKIAFARAVSGSGQFNVWVMSANGSGQTPLTSGGGLDPTWSPDGSKIAYVGASFQGDGPILKMNANGSGKTPLTSVATDSFPTWSPDGTKIAFTRLTDVQNDVHRIFVMNANGSGQTQLTNQAGYTAVNPSWSPDGKKIAYFSEKTNGDTSTEGIYVMNANGSGQAELTHGNHQYPAWSPDGQKIAFAEGTSGPFQLAVVNANGSGETQLTTIGGRMPDWGPTPHAIAPKACVVPRLIGKTLAKARRALRAAHCRLGKVKRVPVAKRSRRGRVIRQHPGAGRRLRLGAKVDVVVGR